VFDPRLDIPVDAGKRLNKFRPGSNQVISDLLHGLDLHGDVEPVDIADGFINLFATQSAPHTSLEKAWPLVSQLIVRAMDVRVSFGWFGGSIALVTSAVQVWNPDDWELFSLSLLQDRHGALNVHKIPATHKGDFGIDFYCTKDAVAYQCYAVEEPIDIATRAERQKKKITRDLGKIVANHAEIATLFRGTKIRHWILLAPLHDSKDVNLHCSKQTTDIRNAKCQALDDVFEVGIHDLSLFPSSVIAAGLSAVSYVKLSVPVPSKREMDDWSAGSSNLLANAHQKLVKRTGPETIDEAVAEATMLFLQGNALLDALRNGSQICTRR
jgi:hypothetical protein